MTNEELVMKIKAGEDPEQNMEQLYIQVRSFIHTVACWFKGYEDLEDLEQEGYLALYAAIDGYDPAAGCKFLTYAKNWIRQGMQRYIQFNGSCLHLPVQCLENVRKLQRFHSKFELEHGREPSSAECAYYLGYTLEQVERLRQNSCVLNLASLDSPVTGADGGEDATVGDFVASPESLEDNVLDKLQQEQLKAVLWGCVDALDGDQPDIIRKRYQDRMTLEAIGQEYGVNREAIRQQENKALRRLRNPRISKQLRPFLPEEQIYSMAIHGGGAERFEQTWTSSTERVAVLSADWEERRRQRLDTLDQVRQQVAAGA